MEAALRPATREDLPGIVAIYNEAVQDPTGTYDAEPHTLEQRTVWFEHYEAKKYPILVEDMVRGWGSLSPFVERPGFRHTAICSVYVAEVSYTAFGSLQDPPREVTSLRKWRRV